jgi:hypothetical protein
LRQNIKSQKSAGLIPEEAIGLFSVYVILQLHYDLVKNEYQEPFWGGGEG